jgi:cold-inducible RNA-binding protein
LAADPFIGLTVIFYSGDPGQVPFRVERSNTMEVRVYVGNLNKATTQDEINTLFATAGTVSSVDLVTDKGTGKSKGFAFVSMPTQEDADKAISMFNDYSLAENNLKVNVAKPRVS